MASIELKLTQDVVDSGLLTDLNRSGDLFANLALMLADAVGAASIDAAAAGTALLAGGKLRVNYPGGAWDEISGVLPADPKALAGIATATSIKQFVPGQGVSEQAGVFTFRYDLGGAAPTMERVTSLTSEIVVQSQLADDAPTLDELLGNGTLQARGAVTVNADGQLGGFLTGLTLSASKLLDTASLSGNFALTGNVGQIAAGDGALGIGGALNGMALRFKDGSVARLDGLSARVEDIALNNALVLLEGGNLADNDLISVALPDWLPRAITIASGDGNDTLVLAGGGGQLHADAGAGNDVIVLQSGEHRIDGGAGIDTLVYAGARADYTVEWLDDGFAVHGPDGSDVAVNVERLQFAGVNYAFDIDGAAGQAYRIYQAALDRTPDIGGLSHYMRVLEGSTTLVAVAASFLDSREFADKYGANLSDAQFVERLYENVLHRPSEQGGFDFWSKALATGVSRAEVLAAFSESAENKASLIGVIGLGMEYLVPG